MNRSRPIPFVLSAAVAAGLTAAPLPAQQPSPPGEIVDRVVAVAGDSVVLESDLTEALFRLAAQGQQIPEDPAALERLRGEVLQGEIDQLLLLQAAERDSLVVSDDEVEARVERFLAQQRQAFGGAQAFEQGLRDQGMTPPQYRDMLAQEARRSLLIQQYTQQQLTRARREGRLPPASGAEIREFFEQRRSQLGERPATITFRQVVVAPEPSDSARAAARSLAQDVLAELREGADFARLARQHSDDPGSRQDGGDLGWFRPSDMVPAFADAASALRPGQVSGIVETPFGFHIIKLERTRGRELKARHILFQAPLSDADHRRAEDRAIEVAEKARAGTPVEELIDEYGDPAEQRRVGPYPRDQLPEPYATELADVEQGAVVGPFPLQGESGQRKWAVVKVGEATEAGEYALDDVRAQIRQELQRQKLLDEMIERLRARNFVDVRL